MNLSRAQIFARMTSRRGLPRDCRRFRRILCRLLPRAPQFRILPSRGIAARSRRAINSRRCGKSKNRFPALRRSFDLRSGSRHFCSVNWHRFRQRTRPVMMAKVQLHGAQKIEDELGGTTPPKRILILASKLGYQTRAFADAAAKLGVEVSFGTDRCHKLDDPWADGALALHFENPQAAAAAIAREMKAHLPDAILALGDRPTPAAAYAARALGLPGNPPEAVEICRNKFDQRETLRASGLRVPVFRSFSFADDIESAASQLSFPCVVKPLSLAASQGVIRANDAEEFRSAISRIAALLASPEIQVSHEAGLDRLLVEELHSRQGSCRRRFARSRPASRAGDLRQARSARGPVLRRDNLRDPVAAAPRISRSRSAIAQRASVAALGLLTGPFTPISRERSRPVGARNCTASDRRAVLARAAFWSATKISLEELLIRHVLDLWRRSTSARA